MLSMKTLFLSALIIVGVFFNSCKHNVDSAEEIVKIAKEDDLIVMAYHDKTKGVEKILDKSVTKDVIRSAPCSVLVVKIK